MDRRIVKGAIFDTPFETGCVALTKPDALGNFDGIDSDGVECGPYSVNMVIAVRSAGSEAQDAGS